MKKQNGLTKAYIEGRKIQDERLHLEDLKKSTGSANKKAEPILRNYLLKNGIQCIKDVRSRGIKKPDIKVLDKNGKQIIIEVKTGSGAVDYIDDEKDYDIFTEEHMTEEHICNGVDYVAFAPFAKLLNDSNIHKSIFIFSRNEFISLLLYMFRGTKGKTAGTIKPALNITKHGKQLNLQTISNKPLNLFYDYLDEFKPMTAEEFKNTVLR